MTNNSSKKSIKLLVSSENPMCIEDDSKIKDLTEGYPPEVVHNLHDLLSGKKRWGDLAEISRFVITRKGQIGVTHGAVSQGLSRRDPAYIKAALTFYQQQHQQ